MIRMNTKTALTLRPGRPREFDGDAVLDKAIIRFSEYGYHGSSISDLNGALGLTSGSIYKAWGDKRGLFLAALDRYMLLRAEAIRTCLAEQSSGRNKIEALLQHYARDSTGPAGRTGCMVVETAAELAVADEEIAGRIAAQHRKREAQLCELAAEAQRDGSLHTGLEAAVIAKLLLTLQQGMRVLGKTGATPEEMQPMIAGLMQLLS